MSEALAYRPEQRAEQRLSGERLLQLLHGAENNSSFEVRLEALRERLRALQAAQERRPLPNRTEKIALYEQRIAQMEAEYTDVYTAALEAWDHIHDAIEANPAASVEIASQFVSPDIGDVKIQTLVERIVPTLDGYIIIIISRSNQELVVDAKFLQEVEMTEEGIAPRDNQNVVIVENDPFMTMPAHTIKGRFICAEDARGLSIYGQWDPLHDAIAHVDPRVEALRRHLLQVIQEDEESVFSKERTVIVGDLEFLIKDGHLYGEASPQRTYFLEEYLEPASQEAISQELEAAA